MSGFFTIQAKNKLAEMPVGARIDESDFSTLDDGVFVQLKYNEEDDKKVDPYIVKPGLWTIIKTMQGLDLQETSFVTDRIIDDLVQTKEVTDKVDCFFRNLHVYAEEGIEVPKRALLLYGPPGGGKTTVISKIANKYVSDKKTAVIVWVTDKFESHTVKDFVKSFTYEGVNKLILIVEDIGGSEIEQSRMRSDASLLSLLDNQEKTFSIPVLILATTNYPENMMGNLTNRPQRFDDKIKMPPPNALGRQKLLKFFGKTRETPEALELLGKKSCEGFTPAHIREVVIRSRIYEKTMESVIKEMIAEVETFIRGFDDKKSAIGFSLNE